MAGYAHDLGEAISREYPLVVCAVDRHGLNYPDEVVAVIGQDEAEDYRRAARILAEHTVDAVLIQHKLGVYGGAGGAHVLGLAHELRLRDIPYVVTLHSVPAEAGGPDGGVMAALIEGAAAVTVFSETARGLAVGDRMAGVASAGGVVKAAGVASAAGVTNAAAPGWMASPRPVAVVPYGVPPALVGVRERAAGGPEPVPLRRALVEALADARGGRILATLGLIGPGKELETAISAVAKVAADHPDVRYIVAGATDPDEAREHGEAYRDSLLRLADDLGLAAHVRILDAYLTPDEIATLLGRAEVYLAPRLHPDCAYSGTLTLATAAGCPIVAADHPYAREVVAAGAGVVVSSGDVPGFAAAVAGLLADGRRLAAASAAGVRIGRSQAWPRVARRATEVLRDAVDHWTATSGADQLLLPELHLHHIGRLVDEIGIVRSARGRGPDVGSGYGVDEAARLAIVAAGLLAQPVAAVAEPSRVVARGWATTALRLLRAAVDAEGVRSGLAYSGIWVDEPRLGDHVGRVLWALGAVAGSHGMPERLRGEARPLRDEVSGLVVRMPGLLANAYCVLGLCREPDLTQRARAALAVAAARLDEASGRGSARWRWFSDRLGPEAPRLPQALIAAGHRLGDAGMVRRGQACLDWYARRVGLGTVDGELRLGADERPADTGALVEAFAEAYGATRARQYARLARRAFGWFVGTNRLAAALYDPETGGCRDVLGATWVSPNQGAEATLAYHQALLALLDAELAVLPGARKGTPQSLFV